MLAAASLLADIRRPQGIIVPVSRRLTPGLARERKGWSGHRGSVTSYEPDLVVQCDRMHVPSDSFNGRSPEKHAALMLENLFTFAACKVAMAQMQGDGRGDLGSFGGNQYVTLRKYMKENPLGSRVDSKEWLENLVRIDRGLAVRVIETRYAYASKDFEWDQMKRLALENMNKDNIGVLRGMLEREIASEDSTDDDTDIR